MSSERTAGLTSRVAEFVAAASWQDFPADVVTVALDHVLDSYGVMLAGVHSDPARIVREVYGARPGKSSVLGTGARQDPIGAALANGVAGHALDYDDTQLSTSPEGVYGLLTHPSVPVLAACTAIAEETGASGRELLTGFIGITGPGFTPPAPSAPSGRPLAPASCSGCTRSGWPWR